MTKYTLYKTGLKVFGDKDKFRRWFSKTNCSLGGFSPMESKREDVYNCLMRIEYGNLA